MEIKEIKSRKSNLESRLFVLLSEFKDITGFLPVDIRLQFITSTPISGERSTKLSEVKIELESI